MRSGGHASTPPIAKPDETHLHIITLANTDKLLATAPEEPDYKPFIA
jgi:hypothetical protein